MNPISSKKLRVHFMSGDGKGWALDEDRRQMRQALRGSVIETSLAQAEIIHTPFWQGLSSVAPEILKQKFVIAHADNPPFFYLKQPDFSWGQQIVNLWIARSQEAFEQFQRLKLPVEYIPYTIDSKLFFPIEDKKALRRKFGIPEDAYVIANFHRDSEGSDLTKPKVQKAPELFLAILKSLRERGCSFHVLLAGPRRNWLRKALAEEEMPFTFIGKQDVTGDDFGVNILKRSQLNELINAADLYLIPSRWEGGPQSVMEVAACRCKILSTPLGVAKDILEADSLYHSVDEAAECITKDQESNFLQSTVQPQWEKWRRFHTTVTLQEGLQKLYERLPEHLPKLEGKKSSLHFYIFQIFHVLRRWLRRTRKKSSPRAVGWYHELGKDSDLDHILLNVSKALSDENIKQHPARGQSIEIIGWPSKSLPSVKKGVQRLQWIVPQMGKENILPEALLVAPSVQDILNLRDAGCFQPAIVLPWPIATAKNFSEEPLVIAKEDRFASLEIWKAMMTGRPIVYPDHLAYYEQVFHAGFAFISEAALPEIIQRAREKALELRTLSKIPTLKESHHQFMQLLSILNLEK